MANMGVGDGWAGWAIAHPSFGRSVNSILTKQIVLSTLKLAHPALDTFLRPWVKVMKAIQTWLNESFLNNT